MFTGYSQNIDIGAWYLYFWNVNPKEGKVGFQGDVQYRNPEIFGSRVQFLFRGSATYQLKNPNLKLAAGYTNISNGIYNTSRPKIGEHNIYEDLFIKHKMGSKLNTLHRLRLEERIRPGEHLRTRFRYQLVLNFPLNNSTITNGTWYLAAFDELFINGGKNVGPDLPQVSIYDRNRLYLALGYALKPEMKFQVGYMNESTSNSSMNLMQFSLIHQIR